MIFTGSSDGLCSLMKYYTLWVEIIHKCQKERKYLQCLKPLSRILKDPQNRKKNAVEK